jgi:dienelactone hydrolase
LNGVPLPSVSPVLADASHLPNGIAERAAFAAAFSDPAARTAVIPVENIHGPVLTVAGEDDQLWPSVLFAERIHGRLDEHHFPFAHENLVYPGAGHLVFGIPYTLAGPSSLERSGVSIVLGGTPAANEAAHVDDWPKVLAFIAQH